MNRSHLNYLSAAVSLAFLAAALAPTAALAETWTIDPGHTNAQFTVAHLMVSRVVGSIPLKSGTVVTPAGSEVPTSVEATLDVASLDSKNANRDKDLRSPNFFDVEKYPTIQFKSRSITKGPGDKAFTMTGDLTIHGVTKQVSIPAEILGQMTDSRGRKHIGYTGSLKIKRDDYGMSIDPPIGGALLAGHDVQIDIQIEAVVNPTS